ncbi:response regulator [Candidatus Latescibacterota bacterium]
MEKNRILIVDDAVNLTSLYKQELENAGYCIDVTTSFSDAIELLRKNIYNLIVIETKLKNTDGYYELCNKLNFNYDIPVIINTTSSNFENEFPLWSVDADVCILKSSNYMQLMEKIDILCSDFACYRKTRDVYDAQNLLAV